MWTTTLVLANSAQRQRVLLSSHVTLLGGERAKKENHPERGGFLFVDVGQWNAMLMMYGKDNRLDTSV